MAVNLARSLQDSNQVSMLPFQCHLIDRLAPVKTFQSCARCGKAKDGGNIETVLTTAASARLQQI